MVAYSWSSFPLSWHITHFPHSVAESTHCAALGSFGTGGQSPRPDVPPSPLSVQGGAGGGGEGDGGGEGGEGGGEGDGGDEGGDGGPQRTYWLLQKVIASRMHPDLTPPGG